MGVTGAVTIVLAALLLVSCGDEDDRAGDESTTSAPSSTTTGDAARLGEIELGAAVDLGPGDLVGVHPAGAHAYVLADDPSSNERGCEGAERSVLWAQPIDGGERELAIDGSSIAGRVLTAGDNGIAVLVDQCEGFLSAFATAVPKPDGSLGSVRRIEISGIPETSELVPSTITWGADRRSWIAVVQPIQSDEAANPEPDDIVRIARDGPITTLKSEVAVTAAAELSDGTIVYATPEGVHLGDAAPTGGRSYGLEVSPDGRKVAAFGEEGVTVLEPGEDPQVVFSADASTGSWSPNGDAIVFLAISLLEGGAAGPSRVLLVTLDGGEHEIAGDGGFATPRFTPDGGVVVFSRAVAGEDGFMVPRTAARPVR